MYWVIERLKLGKSHPEWLSEDGEGHTHYLGTSVPLQKIPLQQHMKKTLQWETIFSIFSNNNTNSNPDFNLNKA